ncbi:SEC14-like protein 2 [Araneus ventricosus]|uniref:SEC14-like protein 2 n=1 Tax=Araneus ventricosus TaxID=182803 RepID=A0A4Y2PPV9_ARAVE|nr:SEC14-like protein 2 [Araneus ventricosus]
MCLPKDLTGKQELAISELRGRLKNAVPPEMYDDTLIFYKFLKARNFNINQAESMLRKHLEFRKIMQIDSILTDYKAPEVCEKYLSQNFLGYDKEGSPVYMSAIGNTDSRGVFRSANKVDVLKCCLQVIETGLYQAKLQTLKLGKPVTQCVYIYDMDKMTLARATDRYSIEHFLIAVNIFQDNYPELLKAVYVINGEYCEFYFFSVYNLYSSL